MGIKLKMSGSAAAPTRLEPTGTNKDIVDALKSVFDPEIPVDIYELGLIYDVVVSGKRVDIKMTLTSPACPVAGILPGQVEDRVANIDWVSSAHVELVWDPPWSAELMSEAAQLELGFF